MENAEIDRLIKSFNRFMEVGIKSPDGPDHVWAVDILNELLAKTVIELSEPEKLEQYEVAWKIILRMLELAQTRDQLSSVSYQLGKLVQLNRSNAMDGIAQSVPQNPRLSYAVSHIYTTDAELREQLRSLGCPWAVLGFEDETEERLLEHLKPVVEDWLQCVRQKSDPDPEEISWAVRAIDNDTFEHPNRSWRAILLIAAACRSKTELRCLRHHLATLLSGGSGIHYLQVAASEVACNRRFAYVVSKLKSTGLARSGGWYEFWNGIIALAEQELLDKPLTSRELQVARR